MGPPLRLRLRSCRTPEIGDATVRERLVGNEMFCPDDFESVDQARDDPAHIKCILETRMASSLWNDLTTKANYGADNAFSPSTIM